ncbi:hypothetical protein PIB30_088785 [Stylosanthes scabra]|uniref:Uncharacterized protein n=1 Tax=Stylosanthes scabra TaxID=79078 RepID=A0ABU6UVK5_9FABA|nr:hypothetical protein [Stylosanthes scabra]
MGSGVIYYEYEKREKFEDYDEKVDAELGTIKIRRYHFDDESFVHPLHSVRIDPDRPYKIPIKPLLADHLCSSSGEGKSSARGSLHRSVAGKMMRPPRSWELILPSEGWMCEGDEGEKEIGGMEPSPLPMDVDADEELQHYPEHSPIHSGYASTRSSPGDSSDQHFNSH